MSSTVFKLRPLIFGLECFSLVRRIGHKNKIVLLFDIELNVV